MPPSPFPTPELAALSDICARLDGAGIEYMLTGSLAMSYYARPRMTRDIDLVVALEAAQVEQMAGALGADYHVDTGAVTKALLAARPWNIIHTPSVVKIDLIPRKDTPYRRAEFERRRRVELAGVPLRIVSVEDLILSKLEWLRESGSEQQRRDVGLLLEAPLDRAYLDEWAARLGLDGLLKDAGNACHQSRNRSFPQATLRGDERIGTRVHGTANVRDCAANRALFPRPGSRRERAAARIVPALLWRCVDAGGVSEADEQVIE